MGSHAVVIDISSDEEDCSWTTDSLTASLGRSSSKWGDNNDVIVVDEIPAPPAKRRRQGSGCLALEKGRGSEDGDDDCVVLEADPDKPVLVDDCKCDGEDELLIVAEKGELACRDYPHSRHLCATFPFSSSPHEKYCDLCHCYVCDSQAPCSYWGNGNSSFDHCHSTDKEERWKALRQSSKQKNMGATQPQGLTGSSSFNIPPFRDPMPTCHFDPNPVLIPRSTPNSLWFCSATSISNSNTIDKRKRYQPTILSCHSLKFGMQTPKSYPLNPSVEHVPRKSSVDATSTARLMYSRTRYKRPRTMQAVFSRLNNPSCNTVCSNNRSPSDVPIASNRPECSEVGQLTSHNPLLALPGRSVDQMQATLSSKSAQSVMKDSISPLVTAADINQQSWHDILASVAPELRVPISSDNSNIRHGQQPLMVPSPSSVPCNKPFTDTNSGQV